MVALGGAGFVARRGAHLAAERGGAERRQGARRSVAVPNGEGVASGSATPKFTLKHDYACALLAFTTKLRADGLITLFALRTSASALIFALTLSFFFNSAFNFAANSVKFFAFV